MSGYWGSLERCLNESWGAIEIANALVEGGFAAEANYADIVELLQDHVDLWFDDDDGGDRDARCDCGKWIELGCYDMEDHQASLLRESGLLINDD